MDTELQGMKAARAFLGEHTKAQNHDPNCRRTHPQVLFAFWQSDFQGGHIPFWHVMSESPSRHSTLSIQGLREWGVV